MEIYPNTPILESPAFNTGYFFGNVILPIAMVLYVLLYFRTNKHIYIYAVIMIFLFVFTPTLILLVFGLLFIGLDKVSIWAKERTKT